MRTTLLPLVLLALAGCATRPAPADRLARLLDGRSPGEPVKCLQLRDIRSSQVIDGIAIVYTTQNGTLYVNQPKAGAAFLHSDTILVTDTHTSQLCDIDTVKLMNPGSRMITGSVGLDLFVPYPKPKSTRH
ncbi:hypothetical protein [Tahibacter harae]|uniref:Lipoprotein n=1 Tax=Tahibacter harae TaxID=2963937 RepID=A0ABT1QTD2_9GAMM|nr:hypothetical protein [Tahibacter harae]MCQ4165553.1 hypothetical protein [Tahibacter harae]